MKNVKLNKIQPAEVRGYTVCPEVRTLVTKMGWTSLRPAGYLLALERLETEGNYTTNVENILLALSDISPTLRPSKQSVRIILAKAEDAGTIRKTITNGRQQHYALTIFGREVVEQIRTAVIAFAEWERTLPGGRYTPAVGKTKNNQIKALKKANATLNAVNNEQARIIREQDARIYELEMLVASLTRRP